MALKVLMLRKKIDDAKKRLEALRSKGGDYDKREIGRASCRERV